MGEIAQSNFLKKSKKKFGNSLMYKVLEYMFFTKGEISLDLLSAKFKISKMMMYSITRHLEGECFVSHATYSGTEIFFKICT